MRQRLRLTRQLASRKRAAQERSTTTDVVIEQRDGGESMRKHENQQENDDEMGGKQSAEETVEIEHAHGSLVGMSTRSLTEEELRNVRAIVTELVARYGGQRALERASMKRRHKLTQQWISRTSNKDVLYSVSFASVRQLAAFLGVSADQVLTGRVRAPAALSDAILGDVGDVGDWRPGTTRAARVMAEETKALHRLSSAQWAAFLDQLEALLDKAIRVAGALDSDDQK